MNRQELHTEIYILKIKKERKKKENRQPHTEKIKLENWK